MEVDGVKCRNVFLRNIQADYADGETLQLGNPERYRNMVILLCQVFRRVRVAGGTTISALIDPILDCMKTLLTKDPINEDLLVVSTQLQVLGPELKLLEPEKFRDLITAIRIFLTKSHKDVSEQARAGILILLELNLSNWQLDPPTEEIYFQLITEGTRRVVMTPTVAPNIEPVAPISQLNALTLIDGCVLPDMSKPPPNMMIPPNLMSTHSQPPQLKGFHDLMAPPPQLQSSGYQRPNRSNDHSRNETLSDRNAMYKTQMHHPFRNASTGAHPQDWSSQNVQHSLPLSEQQGNSNRHAGNLQPPPFGSNLEQTAQMGIGNMAANAPSDWGNNTDENQAKWGGGLLPTAAQSGADWLAGSGQVVDPQTAAMSINPKLQSNWGTTAPPSAKESYGEWGAGATSGNAQSSWGDQSNWGASSNNPVNVSDQPWSTNTEENTSDWNSMVEAEAQSSQQQQQQPSGGKNWSNNDMPQSSNRNWSQPSSSDWAASSSSRGFSTNQQNWGQPSDDWDSSETSSSNQSHGRHSNKKSWGGGSSDTSSSQQSGIKPSRYNNDRSNQWGGSDTTTSNHFRADRRSGNSNGWNRPEDDHQTASSWGATPPAPPRGDDGQEGDIGNWAMTSQKHSGKNWDENEDEDNNDNEAT